MNVIFLLIPVALLFVVIAIGVFFWAVRSDQFEDLDRQGSSILFEEESGKNAPSAPANTPSTPANAAQQVNKHSDHTRQDHEL